MGSMDHIQAAIGVPIFVLFIALTSTVVWNFHRKHRYLLWLAASMLCAAVAWPAVGGLHAESTGLAKLGAGLCSVAASASLAQAVALRWGRHVQWSWVLACVMGMLLGSGLLGTGHHEQRANIVVGALGCGLILVHILPTVWRSASRHRMEQLLLLVYSALTASVLLSPWWQDKAAWQLGSTAMPWLLARWLPLALGLLGISMLACAFTDGTPALRGERDGLTGLLNRGAFEAACGARPAEQQITVLVLCDIDQLPGIRQQWGNAVADDILRSFARLLQSSVRDGDHVARLSHEEFGLALRQMEIGSAQVLVQRIQHNMRQQYGSKKAAAGSLTVSFGISLVRETDSFEAALHRCDVLLCQAQEEGLHRMGLESGASLSMADCHG